MKRSHAPSGQRSRVVLILTAAVVAAGLLAIATPVQAAKVNSALRAPVGPGALLSVAAPVGVDSSGPEPQSPAESLREDLSLVAEANDWTLEQAAADRQATEIIGDIAGKVARGQPHAFVGSSVNPAPGGAPALYIKGPASVFVEQLVEGAGIPIEVVDGQPYSFTELETRQLAVHKALVAYGFRQVATGVDVTGAGRIPAEVTRVPGVDSTPSAVLAAMPGGLRASVDLTVSDKSVTSLEFAYGGERVRGGGSECTSGWPVINNARTLVGITTAGHCDGMNEIDMTCCGLTFDLTHQAEHRGTWGDVEWKTANAFVLPAMFYASETSMRSATSVEPVSGISVGESVCQYGRSSNVRHCSPDIFSVSVTCTFDGILTQRLAQTDTDVGIPGDSGGGWSNYTTAYGSHVGNCGVNKEVFSVADYYDEALGVTVWLYFGQ